MTHESLISYLRTHRNRSGFTQRELAQLVGHGSEAAVSRHERGKSLPSFRVALAYAAVFQVDVRELFPALHEAVAGTVEAQIGDIKFRLGQKSAKDRDAKATAHKLEFLTTRDIGAKF